MTNMLCCKTVPDVPGGKGRYCAPAARLPGPDGTPIYRCPATHPLANVNQCCGPDPITGRFFM